MSSEQLSDNEYLFTSESVTEGHPDKMADQISDGVLDAVMRDDPQGRVACETLVNTGLVVVSGEISTETYVDIQEIARETIRKIGYVDADLGFSADSCAVLNAIDKQSPDIAQGVDSAHEVRVEGNADDLDVAGAGDQGMMFGYASNETAEYMPLPISLAHRLAERLAAVRKDGTLAYLRPDGKSQVTIEYAFGVPKRAKAVVIAAQHDPEIDAKQLREDVIREVIRPVMGTWMDDETEVHVNRSGSFVLGGPAADSGLSGRKNIVDTYGAVGRHGGGSYSGKDPSKVDRSASYAARWVAKNIVAAGLADRVEVELSYAIGHPQPIGVSVETFGTHKFDHGGLTELVREVFDLSPNAIIRDLRLRRPIYRATSAYGHFGRHDIDAPWEETNRVDDLRKASEKLGAASTA